LSKVVYAGGQTAGKENVQIAVYDGQAWSNASSITITTQVPQVVRPVVSVQNQTANVNTSIQAASLITAVSDPAGYVIQSYEFRDYGSGGGYLNLGGVKQTAGTWVTVSASDLAKLTYVGGASPGNETVDVSVWDGYNWSSYQTATVTTNAVALPVVVARNQTVNASASIQASTLIASANDPNGTTITTYRFRDDGGGGGYLSLSGVKQATSNWISVPATSLSTLTFVANTQAGTETIDIEAYNGTNWSNYSTATVTTQGNLKTNPVLNLLTDAGVKADATNYLANNALSYQGMLNILNDVAANGVTTNEMADLKTIVSYFNKSNGIQVSSYVAYITNALVNGDPANTYWTGGNLSAVPLGNLAAGSSANQMNELIGKWFLGTDLPAPIFDNGDTGTYVNDTAPLFGSSGLPLIGDVNQHDLGDCYLLASLAEVAQQEPSAIQAMITDNGNSTYGIRFYVGGAAMYVTVNKALPESNGRLLGNMASNIWASLIEKAYVELNAEPGATNQLAQRVADTHPQGNEYLLIDGGWGDPITQITGRPVKYYDSTTYSASAWASLKSIFVSAIQSGLEVDFATLRGGWPESVPLAYDSQGRPTFWNSHMYSSIGYDAATGDFILRNPWGSNAVYDNNTVAQFEAAITDLQSVYGTIWVATTTATGAGAAVAATAATTVSSVLTAQMSGSLTVGTSIPIMIDFSQPVSVTGAPTLSLNDGGAAVYSSGSGSSLLTFNYVVGANDLNVTSLAATVINLNGGTVRDGNGADASLTLNGVAQAGPRVQITVTSAARVRVAYQTMLQIDPGASYAAGVGAQIDGGLLTSDQYMASLLSVPGNISSVLPALIDIDAFYNVTPSSASLAAVTANAQTLISNGMSTADLWSIFGLEFAHNGTFGNLYGNLDNNTFVNQIYTMIFGYAPSSPIQTVLANEVTTLSAAYMGWDSVHSDAIGGKGAVFGALLYYAENTRQGHFYTAGNTFLSNEGRVAFNTAVVSTYDQTTELTQQFPTGTTNGSGSGMVAAIPDGSITITASGTLVDPGRGDYVLQFISGASNDTLVLHADGVSQVFGFDTAAGDTIDVHGLLMAAQIDSGDDPAVLGNYISVTSRNGDALIGFDGAGHGNFNTIAVFNGQGSVIEGLSDLIQRNVIQL
jgi:Calpain family cysteine protease